MLKVMITAITTEIVATRQLESSRVRVHSQGELDILYYSLDFPFLQRDRPSQQSSFSKPIWTFGGLGCPPFTVATDLCSNRMAESVLFVRSRLPKDHQSISVRGRACLCTISILPRKTR